MFLCNNVARVAIFLTTLVIIPTRCLSLLFFGCSLLLLASRFIHVPSCSFACVGVTTLLLGNTPTSDNLDFNLLDWVFDKCLLCVGFCGFTAICCTNCSNLHSVQLCIRWHCSSTICPPVPFSTQLFNVIHHASVS